VVSSQLNTLGRCGKHESSENRSGEQKSDPSAPGCVVEDETMSKPIAVNDRKPPVKFAENTNALTIEHLQGVNAATTSEIAQG
jgi:hypothetical protein